MLSYEDFLARVDAMTGPTEEDRALYDAAETYGVFDGPHQSCWRTIDGNIIWSWDYQKRGFLGRKKNLRIFAIAKGGRPVLIVGEGDDQFGGFVATKVMSPITIKLHVEVDDPLTVLMIIVDEFVRQSEGIFGWTTAKRAYED
jgi:hypothetical protein